MDWYQNCNLDMDKKHGFIKEKELGYNSDIIAICEDLKEHLVRIS